MEIEPSPSKGEFLSVREFVTRAEGLLNVEKITDLDSVNKAKVLMAFHFDRCDRDAMQWIPELDGFTDKQKEKVWELLCTRGGEMCTMAQIIEGYDGPQDFNIRDLV